MEWGGWGWEEEGLPAVGRVCTVREEWRWGEGGCGGGGGGGECGRGLGLEGRNMVSLVPPVERVKGRGRGGGGGRGGEREGREHHGSVS